MERSPASPDEPRTLFDGRATTRPGRARPAALWGVLAALTACLVAATAIAVPSGAASAGSSGTGAAVTSKSSKSGRVKHGTSKGTTIAPVSPTSTHRVTFGIAPASATGPDGRSSFDLGVTPGGVLSDDVALVNYSKVPLSLGLSATDGVETTGGGFGLLPPGVKPTGAGSWISLPAGSTTVQVPARNPSGAPGWTVVPFIMRVPFKVTPGDHVAGIVASLRTVGSNASGKRIILDQRVGTRVYVEVAGKLVAHLAVSDFHASYRGTLDPFGQGKEVVTYRIRNAGNVDLAVDQAVGVSQVIGSSPKADVPAIALLLPGASVSERVVVPGVWPQFLLSAALSAQGRPPPGSGLPPSEATANSRFWAFPWPLIVLIVLFVLLWLSFRRWRGRRGTPEVDAAREGGGGKTGPADRAEASAETDAASEVATPGGR